MYIPQMHPAGILLYKNRNFTKRKPKLFILSLSLIFPGTLNLNLSQDLRHT